VLDAATGALRRPRGETFAAVVRSSLGPTLAGRFYEPYAEKLFGVPADRLSAELARRRVGARSGRDLVRRVVRPARERGVFFYPRRGYGQIADALADAAVRAGAQVTTGAEVTRVAAGEDAVDVHTGDGRSRRASQVWSTLPLSLLARLASAPPQVAAAAARLRTRPLTLVYVVLATDRWTSFDAHYFPERDVPMVRVSEPKNYRDSRDDPAGVTVLCAEVPGEHAGGSEIVEALRGSGLPCPDPVAIEVRRVAHAYPVYDLGFAGNLAIVDAWAGSLPRVLTFGRQGLFAHDNTHHALAMAWAAAEAAAGGPVDPRRWHDARRSFLAHVVDD
jgi:protoporphyrinogen oxidase